MRFQNKAQIVVFAFILLNSFAGNIVFGALASFCATHATITKLLVDNPPSVNNLPVNNPTPQDSGNVTIIQEANGSKIYIFRFTDVSSAQDGLVASARYEIVIISPFWFFLEDLFDLLQNIRQELNLLLIFVFCMLEFSKKFKLPKLPPMINR